MILRRSVRASVAAAALSVAIASAAASSAPRLRVRLLRSHSPLAVNAVQPKPLRGVPLTGRTGLTLLVPNDPPVLLNVDTGRVTAIAGIDTRGNPVLSVLAVGRDAVVWLDRRTRSGKPAAEIYVVQHGKATARRVATAWDVAPAAGGSALWLKSFQERRRCALREVRFSGRVLRSRGGDSFVVWTRTPGG